MGTMHNEDATTAQAAEEALAWDLVEHIGELLVSTPALQLRLAQLAAWFKNQDLLPLGYTSWAAFARERLDLGDSWSRDLVRLVEADLPRVKAAVVSGDLPLRVAVKAPGSANGEEEDWLWAALHGEAWLRDNGRRRMDRAPLKELSREERQVLAAALDRVRLLRGLPLQDETAKDQLLAWYRKREDRKALLDQARQVPAPPEHREPPGWPGAEAAPESLQEGLVRVAELRRQLDTVELETGRAWRVFAELRLHRVLGHATLAGAPEELWGVSLRTLQRRQRLANGIDRHPELAEAVDSGALSVKRAKLLVDLVEEDSVAGWVQIAPRVSYAELVELTTQAGNGRESDWRSEYQAALERVGPTDRVSLAASQRPPEPRDREATEELLAAARWLLETAELPKHPIKDRDGWCCQNPECRRRSLRVEAHHIVFRSEGGSDEPENLVTLCRACHLRGIHTGTLRVAREGDTLVWEMPGRRTVVFGASAGDHP